ncbi:hypothetical protein LTR51_006273 [Lithohypha guttulata]|nr:hypothetical protein LTR51_006273 [Lithohypha guttulata]
MFSQVAIDFARSLRQRDFWVILSHFIKDHADFKFKELDSSVSDMVLQIPDSGTYEHMLILDARPADAEYPRLNAWLNSTCNQASRTVLLISSKHNDHFMQTLQNLQLHLLDERALVPVLPLADTAELGVVVAAYCCKRRDYSLTSDAQLYSDPLAWAVSSSPRRLLTAHEVTKVMQLCGSIKGLAYVIKTAEGQTRLRHSVGDETASLIMEFWDDEWLAHGGTSL